jgi:hypothetical protein
MTAHDGLNAEIVAERAADVTGNDGQRRFGAACPDAADGALTAWRRVG